MALLIHGRGPHRPELEHRVAVSLGDEVRHRGVLVRLEVSSRGPGDADVALQDGPGLFGETSRMR